MMDYCKNVACHFHQCHVNGVAHQLQNIRHRIIALWTFESWGMDIIDLIDLLSFRGHMIVLIAIYCFQKMIKLHSIMRS